MYCHNCGEELHNSYESCPSCGVPTPFKERVSFLQRIYNLLKWEYRIFKIYSIVLLLLVGLLALLALLTAPDLPSSFAENAIAVFLALPLTLIMLFITKKRHNAFYNMLLSIQLNKEPQKSDVELALGYCTGTWSIVLCAITNEIALVMRIIGFAMLKSNKAVTDQLLNGDKL
ncbi:MAG: hypothetical protein IKK58_02370 [Clostridia bacterium]|nr:hypothetical protein [Clostridia bacterium]